MNIHSSRIIAHRGASKDAIENTLEAFSLGLDQGADAIECDVHVSCDNELIVIHDPDLNRIFGIDKTVRKSSLAALKEIDARIPALAEVLELVPENRRIFIEIKCGLSAVKPLETLLSKCTLFPSQLVLMEFDLETVVEMKKTFPQVEVLWLKKFPKVCLSQQRKRMLQECIETSLSHGLDGLNLQNIQELDASFISSCHENNLTCYCWTVDDPDRAAELIRDEINGIATNRPGWMREQINRSK